MQVPGIQGFRTERRRILFGVFVSGLLAGFGWFVLRQHEPAFQGKSLSIWLERAFPSRGFYSGVPPREAADAMAGIGTDGLPVLLRFVAAKDTTGRRVLAQFAHEFPFLHLPNQEHRAEKATWAFEVLGPKARPAIPALVRLLNDKDTLVRINAACALGALGEAAPEAVPALIDVLSRSSGPAPQAAALRDAAANALGRIGSAALPAIPHLAALTNVLSAELALIKIKGDSLLPFLQRLNDRSDVGQWVRAARLAADLGTNAEPAIPALLSALNSTNRSIQQQSCYALSRIHQRPELCIPALIVLLDSPAPETRYTALIGLHAFGSEAKPAVPAIIRMIQQSDHWYWLQSEGTNALAGIDPLAAAKITLKPPQ